MEQAALTGLWHGQYSYPVAASAPVAFAANLIEAEDWLGGSITEHAARRVLLSSVRGQRQASRIAFLKTYERNSGPYRTVEYDGTLSEDALEISGEWRTGGWSGRFLMIRANGLTQSERRKIAETVR
jgi:hypothetical protein